MFDCFCQSPTPLLFAVILPLTLPLILILILILTLTLTPCSSYHAMRGLCFSVALLLCMVYGVWCGQDAVVWSIKQFNGSQEYLMRAHFGLPSISAEDAREWKAPIQVLVHYSSIVMYRVRGALRDITVPSRLRERGRELNKKTFGIIQ